MDITTITDREEIRIQRKLDDCALRIREWQRGRRHAPVARSVGPAEKTEPFIVAGPIGNVQSSDETYAEHAEILAEMRAYRAERMEKTNA